MTDVAIKYCPNVWGGYVWQLMRRNADGIWESCDASIDKPGIVAMVKPDETVIEEDAEPPIPPSPEPTKKQLACKHKKPGYVWYEQIYGPRIAWRIEYCRECKSIILATGNVPSHKFTKGWPVLKRIP